jgi:antitoxin YefM
MPSIRPSSDVLPVTQFRANASAVLEQLRATRRPIFLTQHGRGAAVLMDVSVYEALLDRLERLAAAQTATAPGFLSEQASAAGQAAVVSVLPVPEATAPDTAALEKAPVGQAAVPENPKHEKTVAEIKKQLWGRKLQW